VSSAAVLPRIRAALREAWQVVRGVVGENAYEKYLEHHRLHHPDAQPLSEREFWRQHIDRGDRNPGARCC
jgi:uncharacterized short protein YbdD (DUF466 family)